MLGNFCFTISKHSFTNESEQKIIKNVLSVLFLGYTLIVVCWQSYSFTTWPQKLKPQPSFSILYCINFLLIFQFIFQFTLHDLYNHKPYLASLARAVGESGKAMKRGLTATPLVVADVVVAAVVCEIRRASSYVGGGVSVRRFPFPAASVVAAATAPVVVVSALTKPSNKVG